MLKQSTTLRVIGQELNKSLVPDAPLTELGKKQSAELDEMTKNTFQQTAELIVISCMRRPLQTAAIGYPSLLKRLASEGKPAIVLDTLQEVNDLPCDTPSTPPESISSYGDGLLSQFDLSTLSPDYASKKGIYDPDRAPERAKRVRQWLRDRPEREIVVVAHGDILRNIVDGKQSSRPWGNAEVKVFTFASSSDSEASVIEIEDFKTKDDLDEATSSGHR